MSVRKPGSIHRTLLEILMSMNVNHVWNKDVIMKMLYHPTNYKVNYKYVRRSFDATLCRAKKELPLRVYRTNKNNQIKRIS